MSETSNCRARLLKYCLGYGVDIGYGGDPICPSAITVDLPVPYAKFGNHPLNLGGDARNLFWFSSNVLDYVFSSHLLEDFDDIESVLREWIRVLKTDGNLIIYCPDEKAYIEHCRKTGQSHNPCHKHKDFSLLFVKQILRERFPEMEIIHENPHVDAYSFEIVAKKRDLSTSRARKIFLKTLFVDKFLVPGSKRRRIYDLGLTSIQIISNKGWIVFFKKAVNFLCGD